MFEFLGQVFSFILSSAQQFISKFFLENNKNIIVESKAGSGKTTMIYILTKFMKDFGRTLPNIAVFAFNKHIAATLPEKVGDRVFCATLHKHAYACLKYNLGIKKWQQACVDSNKYRVFLKNTCENEDLFEACKPHTKEIAKIYDLLRANMSDICARNVAWICKNYNIQMAETDSEGQKVYFKNFEMISSLLLKAEEWGFSAAQSLKLVDFNDMMYIPLKKGWKPIQFEYVLVDESQDLNKMQMMFAAKTVKWGGKIIFVGDTNQAIYGFNGAMPDGIKNIQRYFKAEKLSLDVCYRCPRSHIEIAQRFVEDIQAAPNAIEGEVYTIPFENILTEAKAGDLIICRSNAPLVKLCFKFLAQGIGAKIRGREIGKNLIGIINNISGKGKLPFEMFESAAHEFFGNIIDELIFKGYDEQDQEIILENDKLQAILSIKEYSKAQSVAEMISYIENVLFSEGDDNVIWLSSIHRAKGLEADRVFIVNWHKMPLKVSEEWQAIQEKNLQYIAVTRAKKTLFFLEPDPSENQE